MSSLRTVGRGLQARAVPAAGRLTDVARWPGGLFAFVREPKTGRERADVLSPCARSQLASCPTSRRDASCGAMHESLRAAEACRCEAVARASPPNRLDGTCLRPRPRSAAPPTARYRGLVATEETVTAAPAGWAEHAEAGLRRAGHRSSEPRMAVVRTLARHGCVLTAREIAERLRVEEGRDIGVATVYRSLDLLEGLGLLHRLDTGEGPSLFEPADPTGDHHHHLICNRCGRVSAFEDPALERSMRRMTKRLAFRVEGHDVALRGACVTCLGGRSAAAANRR